MKAKKFKEIISKIPDDDNVIFTYSMFDFSRVNSHVFHGEEIVEYYKLFTECINKGMISKGYTIKLQDTQPIIHSELRVIT